MATATATKTMVPLTQGLVDALLMHYEGSNIYYPAVSEQAFHILTDGSLTDSEKFNQFADWYRRVRGDRQGKTMHVVRCITHEALSFNLTLEDLTREW